MGTERQFLLQSDLYFVYYIILCPFVSASDNLYSTCYKMQFSDSIIRRIASKIYGTVLGSMNILVV